MKIMEVVNVKFLSNLDLILNWTYNFIQQTSVSIK